MFGPSDRVTSTTIADVGPCPSGHDATVYRCVVNWIERCWLTSMSAGYASSVALLWGQGNVEPPDNCIPITQSLLGCLTLAILSSRILVDPPPLSPLGGQGNSSLSAVRRDLWTDTNITALRLCRSYPVLVLWQRCTPSTCPITSVKIAGILELDLGLCVKKRNREEKRGKE